MCVSRAAMELVPAEGDRLLGVKIGRIERGDTYEMARKYWVVDGRRASRATHVLAVIDGVVEAVYTDLAWHPTGNPRYEGRWEFEGVPCVDSPYVGMSVRSYYGRSSNPVRYIGL